MLHVYDAAQVKLSFCKSLQASPHLCYNTAITIEIFTQNDFTPQQLQVFTGYLHVSVLSSIYTKPMVVHLFTQFYQDILDSGDFMT